MTTSRQQYGFNSSSAHSRLRLTHFRLTRLCYASLLLSVSLLMIGCQSIGSVTGVNGPAHSAPTASRQVADIRTQMAAQYLNTGQLDAAQRQLNRALEADKAYAPAYDMQALLLQREGSAHNWAQADSFFRQAIKHDPSFMPAHNNYGVYLSQSGQYQAALAQFKIAGLALGYEGRIKALQNLGLTARQLGDTQLASQAWVQVLELDRGNVSAHLELVDLLLDSGEVAYAQNLYNEMHLQLGDDAQTPRMIRQGVRLKALQDTIGIPIKPAVR